VENSQTNVFETQKGEGGGCSGDRSGYHTFTQQHSRGKKETRGGGVTLEHQEDGEAPLVDAEDAVESGGQHKGGEHRLPSVQAAGLGQWLLRAGPRVGGAQLGGDHPLLGALQVQKPYSKNARLGEEGGRGDGADEELMPDRHPG